MEKEDIGKFEGERAQAYDDFVTAWIPNYVFLMEMVAGLIARKVPGDAPRVLVAGCGTGNDMLALLRQRPGIRLTGVDPSPEMIAQARSKLAGWARVQWYTGPVSGLPADPAYDAATLLLVLHFLPDDGSQLGLLRDIAERLSPGAPFFMGGIFGSPEEVRANLEVLDAVLPASLPAEERAARFERIATRLYPVPESRLLELMEEAGFERPVRCYQCAIYGGWITRRR